MQTQGQNHLRQIFTAFIFIAYISLFAGCNGPAADAETTEQQAANQRSGIKYDPPAGKVLVFAGQDNESVGGNDRFKDGYVDNIGVPAGYTHYIGFNVGNVDGPMAGLNVESDWQAGPMCLKYYLDSPTLKQSIVHMSIAMVDTEADVAAGNYDTQIAEIVSFLQTYSDRPFLVRIGYEFDGDWNHYDSTAYKQAFRRVVDHLRAAKVKNFATVFASSSCAVPYELWEAYYPGDDYVDWLGYSYWESFEGAKPGVQFARDLKKPVFMAEIAPRGHFLGKDDGEVVWNDWYVSLFKHIDEHADIVKAISYINANWDAQGMWHGQNWGDTRLEINTHIKEQWLKRMALPQFVNATDDPFKVIGFQKIAN